MCFATRPTPFHARVQFITNSLIVGTSKAIRQLIGGASGDCWQKTIDVKRTKPHTGYTISYHVGAYIHFWKRTKIRNRWEMRNPDTSHRKWNQTHPCRSVVHVNIYPIWQNFCDSFWVIAKMDIRQVMPTLLHHCTSNWSRTVLSRCRLTLNKRHQKLSDI